MQKNHEENAQNGINLSDTLAELFLAQAVDSYSVSVSVRWLQCEAS